VFNYVWIDDCSNPWNKLWTILGFTHVCCQPFFAHLIHYSTTVNRKMRSYMRFTMRLCVVAAILSFTRFWPLAYLPFLNNDDVSGFSPGLDALGRKIGWNSTCGQTHEWLRGNQICTYSGKYHLGWSIPMATPSYWVSGVSLHFFMMFVPFVCLGQGSALVPSWVKGLFLMVTGPILAMLITGDLHEQAGFESHFWRLC